MSVFSSTGEGPTGLNSVSQGLKPPLWLFGSWHLLKLIFERCFSEHWSVYFCFDPTVKSFFFYMSVDVKCGLYLWGSSSQPSGIKHSVFSFFLSPDRSWCSLMGIQRVSCASACPSSPPCPSWVVSPQPTSVRTSHALCPSRTPRNYAGCSWMGPRTCRQNETGRTDDV